MAQAKLKWLTIIALTLPVSLKARVLLYYEAVCRYFSVFCWHLSFQFPSVAYMHSITSRAALYVVCEPSLV